MSEYYCSHQPPCCPQLDALREQLKEAEDILKAFDLGPLHEGHRVQWNYSLEFYEKLRTHLRGEGEKK